MSKLERIGFGTAAIGRPQYINIRQKPTPAFSLDTFRKNGIELLNNAYEQGIRYFDTAPGYGMAEEMLMNWALEKDDASLELATKWGYTYVADFEPNAQQHEVKEHSLNKLNEQWAKSRKLLPWLSTYQIHSATLKTNVLENEAVLKRLAKLKREHALNIGITTTGANQAEVLKRALDIEVDGEQLFSLFQVTYNIFDQSLTSLAAEISKQNKKLVIKEALANGRVFPNSKYPNYAKAYEVLRRLAQKYNVGIDAIALRFCMDSISVYKVLSGASTSPQLSDNLKAANFELEKADVAILKELTVNPELYWTERQELEWN